MAQPVIMGTGPRFRAFAASAVALQAVIVNSDERILLLSSPHRNLNGEWQLISGGLEANETLLTGVLREVAEEAGPDLRARPLGTVHAHTFHYDANVQFMVSVYYLLAYEGGAIVPGDDMVDSAYRWWDVDDLLAGGTPLHPSTDYPWLLRRAVELYRLWQPTSSPPLQANL
jgi:ADP-ribose pyrophosphatase YjhB (NUDIX family)